MYKIIGGDNKEYGPISADQVRQWLAEGRLHADSSIQSDADPQWKPLRAFPEFQALCSGNASAEPVKTCGLAIASLVCGCVSMLCGVFAALPGLILGVVGLQKINRSAGTLAGKGMAIAGICASGFFMVFNIFIIAAIALPAFTGARDQARAVVCLNNMKQLNVAIGMYAEDNSGKLPDAARWCDAIQKYAPAKIIFQCRTTGAHYMFNRNLSGVELSRISHAESTVLLFEGNGGWNACGTAADLPVTPVHRGGSNVLFVDGHVEQIRRTERHKQLRWQPGD